MSSPLRLALFGQPVSGSRSPEIHRRFAAAAGLELDYTPVETPAGGLAAALKAFRDRGGSGANVTLPLKHEALECCRVLEASAMRAGAVNTLLCTDVGWKGWNTDGAGLVADLRRLGLDPAGQRILVLGAGGAAAGVVPALLEARARHVFIANRSPEKAGDLARALDHPDLDWGGMDAPANAAPFDLVLQATSLGHVGESPPLEPAWLASGAGLYDLNYGQAHHPFARLCSQLGLRAHDGLGMLVGQAAEAFRIWTGLEPEIDPVLEALRGPSTGRAGQSG